MDKKYDTSSPKRKAPRSNRGRCAITADFEDLRYFFYFFFHPIFVCIIDEYLLFKFDAKRISLPCKGSHSGINSLHPFCSIPSQGMTAVAVDAIPQTAFILRAIL